MKASEVMNEWIVVKTETEILGAVDDPAKIYTELFSNEYLARDKMRKLFCESCSSIVGLCYARISANDYTAKICGECTVITLGVKKVESEVRDE